MARPELGIKRQCMNCGAKFYDLMRDPAVCPKCGTVFQLATGRAPTPISRKNEDEDEEDENRPDVVSLDEVEQSEEADAATDDEEGGDDAASGGSTNDDTFLEEEDGDDDVSDLIDNDGDNDEEG